MAESAVSFLLDQLSVFLREEKQLLGGLEREVEFIRNEMGLMNEFLRFADQNHESNPIWITQFREIAYDVEDVLDKYMLRFGQRPVAHGFSGRVKKAYASVKNLKYRREIASEIQSIKIKLQNFSSSQQRYKDMYAAMDPGSSSVIQSNEVHDSRGDALFLEEDEVVGIEEPKKQLVEWIESRGDGLEVISVVGMGGLGKTTLVKKVYDSESVRRNFDHHVWVVASDNKDANHLLASLITKLVGEIKEAPPQNLEVMSSNESSYMSSSRERITSLLLTMFGI